MLAKDGGQRYLGPEDRGSLLKKWDVGRDRVGCWTICDCSSQKALTMAKNEGELPQGVSHRLLTSVPLCEHSSHRLLIPTNGKRYHTSYRTFIFQGRGE